MKVTFGIYGGRKLLDNPYTHIRPTADMVKQAMFNKLAPILSGAKVLDLFCGTGALGIEAISRGAKEVVFVDKEKKSIELTRANLKNLNIDANTINADFLTALKMLKGKKFDIIILDPPYKAGLYELALTNISGYNLLEDDGIIVCEHEKGDKIDFSPYTILDSRKYGIKEVTYLKNNFEFKK